MTKFHISFESAGITSAAGLPDRALDHLGHPLRGSALVAACSEHFSETAKVVIPGLAVKAANDGSLEVLIPKTVLDDKATDTLKSIPGPHTMQRVLEA